MVLDVGTSNRVLKDDPLYLGLNQDRMSGPEYFEVCSIKGSQCTSLQGLPLTMCLQLYLQIVTLSDSPAADIARGTEACHCAQTLLA